MILTTLHRLEVFRVIARHLNVTRAAAELHVSQSALSQELKALEDAYGVLTKNCRTGIQLTEAGARFRIEAEEILARVKSLATAFTPVSHEAKKTITIGASHGMSISMITFVMAQFKETHPSVIPELYTGINREIEELLLQSKLDLGIATNPKHLPGVHAEPFRSNTLCAIVPANHPLARTGEISLEELAKMPLVIRAGSENGGYRTALLFGKMRQSGFKPNVAFGCTSPDAIKAAVKNGSGAGILARHAVQDQLSKGEFAVLKIKGVRLDAKTYILWRKEKPLSEPLQHFLTLLRKWRFRDSLVENIRSIKAVGPRISHRNQSESKRGSKPRLELIS
jgi:DNA-binding transcriptional LysR family regulator